ncbi:MAG: MATE family efflux transporter [Lachnospiraceae bacterium]|uniref:Probable multidrug resistance protein NorM n=1 Tax=Candidatus Weimeria bifida TaxID=2599074 RepID=A0A6N7J2N8_9FIRM|nr:MATE family efflux transporter [Candidatus Weimeria bifida]RRF97412.1 MAG: MATE family efflux transporter [Lachnospiraceae bacterium]
MKEKIRNKFYDRSKIDFSNLIFSNKQLWAIMIPLIIEQFLNSFMGMMDTTMVARCGDAAVSAVSLSDSINTLVIQLFEALAAGGTIICSQYLGQENTKKANEAARQVVLTIFVLSTLVAIFCITLRMPLLHLIFGQTDAEVMSDAIVYFFITSFSFPFYALFEAGSAFYRAGGNSRFPMLISLISNCVNIAGNAVLIFIFNMGVAGAALSTLFSRILCFAVVYFFLRKPKQPIVIKNYLIRPDFHMIGRVLGIGIPSGVENGMFQFGKLAIQSSVSLLAPYQMSAEAMAIIFEALNGIAGMGIGISMMTIVGQTLGAGRKEEAKYYVVKMSAYAEILIIIGCAIVYLIAKPILILSGLSQKSIDLTMYMMGWISIMKPILWVPAFDPAYGMRAAGDVKFMMILSTISMWLCRVVLATVLIRVFHFGPIAVWIGMFCDWAIRGVIIMIRFFSGKWLSHKVI